MELDYHFVWQQYLSGLISLSHIPSSSQLADPFTKSLSGPAHNSALRKMGVTFVPSNLRGDTEIMEFQIMISHGSSQKKKNEEESSRILGYVKEEDKDLSRLKKRDQVSDHKSHKLKDL